MAVPPQHSLPTGGVHQQRDERGGGRADTVERQHGILALLLTDDVICKETKLLLGCLTPPLTLPGVFWGGQPKEHSTQITSSTGPRDETETHSILTEPKAPLIGPEDAGVLQGAPGLVQGASPGDSPANLT